MSKLLGILLGIFIVSGCSIIDVNSKMNTSKYLIKGLDKNSSLSETSNISYVEESSTEEMVEDLSQYVAIPDNEKNLEEITNIRTPIRKAHTFNSDLLVAKKHFDNKKVKLSIEEMPLNKFIHLLFSKVLNVDYILDKRVQKNIQPVSINIKEKVTKQKLFNIVLNILEEFNIIIDVENKIFYIKNATKRAVDSVHKIYFGDVVPRGMDDNEVIYLMRPFYYNKQITKYNMFIKEYFLSKKALLSIDDFENIIKIKDKVKNIRKALEFYNFIDKPTMRNKSMKLVRMSNMNVEKFITNVTPILENYGILVTKSLKSSGVQFVPIRQINSFLLLSDKQSWIDTVLFWKHKLDVVEKKTSEERDFFVYHPLNRKASELVGVIKKLSSLTESENNTSRGGNSNLLDAQNNENKRLKVVLDKERNNIIIHATKKQYLHIEKMLLDLDTLPKQVLIEVTIADISLTNSLEFGFEWFLKNQGYDIRGLDGKGGAGGTGLLANMFSLSRDLRATFSASNIKSNVNILSNPKLLVLNNHSANINIGNQVPVLTSQVTANDISNSSSTPSVLQSIQYQNTGINLSVKPIINSNGYLTLNISQTVSSAKVNTTSSIASPVIFNRSLQTDVVLKSGETVVLGGLISEDKTKSQVKIPLLGEIPIVGKLFSNTGDKVEKSELVILIKPTILSNNHETKAVSDALLNLVDFSY